jgi:hypothetical protein
MTGSGPIWRLNIAFLDWLREMATNRRAVSGRLGPTAATARTADPACKWPVISLRVDFWDLVEN